MTEPWLGNPHLDHFEVVEMVVFQKEPEGVNPRLSVPFCKHLDPFPVFQVGDHQFAALARCVVSRS